MLDDGFQLQLGIWVTPMMGAKENPFLSIIWGKKLAMTLLKKGSY